MEPLASKYRPKKMDDVVGQKHIAGEGKILRRIIEKGKIPNLIFYGPSGTGKTTIANIIAEVSNKPLYKLNATTASISDIRDVIKESQKEKNVDGIILYLDEIQYFNKKQQQSLLSFIEDGSMTLIASTTENPYFSLFNAILSRATIFEFKPIEIEDVIQNLKRVIGLYETDNGVTINITDEILNKIATASNGDIRKSLNALDILFESSELDNNVINISSDDISLVAQKSSFRYDRDGDEHYDILSALQKSIRGSDIDASLHYLARLVMAEDLQSICRRLMVIAAEDVGLAYPQAVMITKACVDSAYMLGFPEARIPLSEAVIMLAGSPKSNSAIEGIDNALADIKVGNIGNIPKHLKDAHYNGAKKLGNGNSYKYPHMFPNHWVKQQYLPDEIKDRKYYTYGNNKFEKGMESYWNEIKQQK